MNRTYFSTGGWPSAAFQQHQSRFLWQIFNDERLHRSAASVSRKFKCWFNYYCVCWRTL